MTEPSIERRLRRQPKRLTNDVIVRRCNAPGWPAAETVLKRVRDDDRRELLLELAMQCGVQTAPAFTYAAKLLRHHADGGDYPTPAKLSPRDAAFIDQRVAALIRPYRVAGDWRLP